jgi:biopolymer transport protein ExbD
MAKQKASKQKKMQTRVDFTPMVDMMMLLITFFMLCSTLAKPQTMELTMPSKDQNMTDEDKSVTKASYTITMYVTADKDHLYYVAGLPKYDDPTCLQKVDWGKEGIRKVLFNHTTEDGTQPIRDVMTAKAKLDDFRAKNPTMTQAQYDERLKAIKKGDIDGKHIETMTIIIKATDNSNYLNLIDALDEMQICSVGKYVIDKINDNDKKLLEAAGVKE